MAMTIIADVPASVTVGIDTHRDSHVAFALCERGRRLDQLEFPATTAGHRELQQWLDQFGVIDQIGIEGTGSWGAGVARHLTAAGHDIVEVDRPDRQMRRSRGKSDPIDAEAAARAVQAGTATGTPKTRTGNVEAIRALRVARRSAIKARSQAMIQLRSLVTTAPTPLRDELRELTARQLVTRASRFRPGDVHDPTHAAKLAMRSLAHRWNTLNNEIRELDQQLEPLITETAPTLIARTGIGPDSAGQLLVTAGDNPERLRSEAAFAQLCGVAPLPASSGTTRRNRLNRGGDRQANAALHRIVINRLSHDERTKTYMHRRLSEGLSKPEIIRCLKRHVAREAYKELTRRPT